MNSIRTLLICGALGIASISSLPADWPQWHGANRDNRSTETGLLQSWPEGGPKLLWSATGLGGGYGGPAIAQGRIYGTGYRNSDEVVWGLDVKDGKELWSSVSVKQPNYPKMDRGEGPRCTPTLDGDQLFVLGGFGNLVAMSKGEGRVLWQVDLVKNHGGVMMSDWGFSESPLVDGDQVVCTPGGSQGSMAAFDKRTGKLLWQTKDLTDKAAYSSIVIATLGGVRQYVQLTDQHVFGVAPKDGRVLWKASRPGKVAVIPTPICHDDRVYVTSGYGVGCNLFHVTRDGDALKAEQVYANKDMANHHGSVVLLDGHLYGHSEGKGWVCQDFKSGKTVWAEKEKLGKGSLTYADGHFVLRSEAGAGTLVLIKASPEGYQETGRFNPPQRSNKNSWPHPVICDGRLYVRDQGVLLCYDLKP